MTLLVDLGNSRIKWAQRVDNQPGPMQARSHGGDLEPFLAEGPWNQLPAPAGLCCSSVAAPRLVEALTEFAQTRWGLAPRFAASAMRFGRLVNGYGEPGLLGVDRWLAMVGAAAQCDGAFAVIDAGTAVTVDAVDADGHHLGGWILPGRQLMHQSLIRGTAHVRPLLLDSESDWGLDTAGSVAAGIAAALGGAIERLERLFGEITDQPSTLFFCGGDAQGLRPFTRLTAVYQPDLVLRGLAASQC